MKLVRFRGQDTGYSKFRAESAKIERINFPEGTTLRNIFLPQKPAKRIIGDGEETPKAKILRKEMQQQ